MKGKSFKGCNLTNADFINADIRGADFTDAVLNNAIFSFTKSGLQKYQVFLLVIFFIILSAFSGYLLALGGSPIERSLGYKNINLATVIAEIKTLGSIVAFLIITLSRGFVLGICSALLALMPTLILSITPIENVKTVGSGFYDGLEAVPLIATGLAITVLSTSGVAITLDSLPMAILAALTMKRNEAVATTVIISLIGHYITWRALDRDRNFAWIYNIAVMFASIGGTSFPNADLTNACFTHATLKSTNLTEANLQQAC